jgi:class 3 adenylate cyclase/tetratricopeptide (TPR) repeat protein
VQKGWSVEDVAAPCRRVDGIFDATIRLRQNGGEIDREPSGASLLDSKPMAYGIRKTVTIIFVDVADSTRLGTALDPEPLRRVMLRYFEAVADALVRHGGTVEKFIGDAVMAVFGVPVVHEDDALRAVRAAVEAREAMAALNDELERERGLRIDISTGLNTGEVFAGEGADVYTLVTGDAVNTAARLQQAAGRNEILIGDATHRLVRDAVVVQPLEPLSVRGKDDGVVAWRLIDVLDAASGYSRHFEAPLVGRGRELAQLTLAFERAVEERRNDLFTILGPAGIGKSRLVGELGSSLADKARIVAGRCLPYGEGITFWPLREIVQDLTGNDPATPISAFLKDDEDAETIAERIDGAIGRSEISGPAEETFWAVRKLFEALARDRPLIVVFEDIHWAEPTLLDLIDYVAEWSRDAPILLLCLARPELLEIRPAWGGGKLNSASLILEALTDAEADALIENLVGDTKLAPSLRRQIADKAEGNPLFVEQMLALLAESADAESLVDVPPTIQALLAARLDRLTDVERIVVERAAVVGTRFWLRAVAELVPAELRDSVPDVLPLLVRKELIRPDPAVVPGEDGYRFRHILIRDASYSAIAKELRADLHERFATLIESTARDRLIEIEEILGYHLEQAFEYHAELAPFDDAAELAARAAKHLAAAGRRALARGDISAAANLLSRTAALVPPDAPERIELFSALGAALVLAGNLVEADRVLAKAIEAATAAGDRRVELHARLEQAFLRALTSPEMGVEHLRRTAEEALPELETLGDNLGLAKAWRRIADVHWMTNCWRDQERALERALQHAELAGDAREAGGIRMRLAMALYWGPTPAASAIERAERTLLEARGNHAVESTFLVSLAGLHAMSDRLEEARSLLARGEAIAEELGFRLWFAGFSLVAGDVELLAGDPEAAERKLRRGYRVLESLGEHRIQSTVASRLAKTLFLQGRYDEAEQLATTGERLAGTGDVASQIEWRSVRAQLAARRGDYESAERLAREAVRLAEQTDAIGSQANALVNLADVLQSSGRTDETIVLVDRARDLFEEKGNVVAARATGEILTRVQA